jgi:hypothetical protein
MEWVARTISEHPLTAMMVGFSVLLVFYLLFKSMIRLALVFFILVVAAAGYLYFQHPEFRPTSVGDAVEKARTGAHKAVDKGKEVYGKGKELIEKGKEAYERGRELVEKGIDKGKETVDRGKQTAGNIGDRLTGREDEGRLQKGGGDE